MLDIEGELMWEDFKRLCIDAPAFDLSAMLGSRLAVDGSMEIEELRRNVAPKLARRRSRSVD